MSTIVMRLIQHCKRSSSSLKKTGYVWSILSLLTAAAATFGFYMPHWLKGELKLYDETAPAYFGSFRRCNYPATISTEMAINERDSVVQCRRCQHSDGANEQSDHRRRHVLMIRCGRYASFDDIPTLWWKITTVSVGTGTAIAVVMALVTVPAFCTRDIVTRTTARMIGIFQILAAMFILVGCLLYPLGWGNKETKEACGRHAAPFKLGDCRIGFAYVMLLASAVLLFVCAIMSASAANRLDWYTTDQKASVVSAASMSL